MTAIPLREQIETFELLLLGVCGRIDAIADRVSKGKWPEVDYERRKARIPALKAALQTLKDLEAREVRR